MGQIHTPPAEPLLNTTYREVFIVTACPTWTYHGITDEVFQKLQDLGRKQGFAIPKTPSGGFTVQAAGMKIHFRYAWNKSSRSLQLTCTSRPPLLGCSAIKSIADPIVRQSGGKPA